MDFVDSLVLGAIEGVTEFLPISSTGHLILASKVLKLDQTEFLKTFEISIQLGAILSVVVLYFKTLIKNFEIIKRILVAFLPTAVIGLVFYKIIKQYLLGSETVVLITLFLGGIFLIIFEKIHPHIKRETELSSPTGEISRSGVEVHREKTDSVENLENISYKQSFIIGLFQSIAIIPGVSRAAATIVGGLTQNIKRKTIVEFSFLLAVPTMLAASGFDLLKNAGGFSADQTGILVMGFAAAFLTATLAVKFLIRFIKNHSFSIFGVYRIAIAILLWVILR